MSYSPLNSLTLLFTHLTSNFFSRLTNWFSFIIHSLTLLTSLFSSLSSHFPSVVSFYSFLSLPSFCWLSIISSQLSFVFSQPYLLGPLITPSTPDHLFTCSPALPLHAWQIVTSGALYVICMMIWCFICSADSAWLHLASVGFILWLQLASVGFILSLSIVTLSSSA